MAHLPSVGECLRQRALEDRRRPGPELPALGLPEIHHFADVLPLQLAHLLSLAGLELRQLQLVGGRLGLELPLLLADEIALFPAPLVDRR